MTRQLFVRAFVLVGLCGLGAGLCPLPAASAGGDLKAALETSSVYPYPWSGTTVDFWRDVGAELGVAVAPNTGEPYVSYYDSNGGDLWFARYVSSGGNCGAGDWSCQLVDGAGNVGRYSSIAVFTDAAGLNVVISYYDVTNGSLKVARAVCAAICPFETWTIDGGYPPGGSYTGRHTSVAYSPYGGGMINVAYQEVQDSGGESLRYAQTVASGGDCGAGGAAGRWHCWTLYSGEGLGSFNWLTLDSSLMPHLSFYDGFRPLHAWFGASGWDLSTADIFTHYEGLSVSHFTEASGVPHLAFLDDSTDELVYASYVGSGGNCGWDSTTGNWEYWCDVIDEVGTVDLSNRTAAMTADPAGAPIIAYRYALGTSYSSLMLAQPLWAAPPGSVGNCGPEDIWWVCTVADGGMSDVYEAGGVSIASNAYGTAIAYREYITMNNPSLKVMWRFVPLFGDGFESGGTGSWSTTVP